MTHPLASPDWQATKPTEPGIYKTRHARNGSNVERVIVTRKGRGLSVFCPAYNDRVPMSQIGDGELEWSRLG